MLGLYNYLINLITIAITNAKIPRASAKAIARIIVDLTSPAAEGFLPIAFIAARPIKPIAIAGQKAPRPKARAILISIIINIKK